MKIIPLIDEIYNKFCNIFQKSCKFHINQYINRFRRKSVDKINIMNLYLNTYTKVL